MTAPAARPPRSTGNSNAGSTELGDPSLVVTPRLFDRGDIAYIAYALLPLGMYLSFARALGWLEMLVRPSARRAVRANLEAAFGATKSAAELDRITRQVFEGHQMRVMLVLVVPLMAADGTLERRFPLHDIERLDGALAEGKGAIIIGSHVNSIGVLLAMVRLRLMGYDVRVPMPDATDAWPLTFVRRVFHRLYGARTVSELLGAFYAQFNVRPLMRILDQNAIILLMGDGWHSASFVDAEFLGRMLPFTNGPLNVARLAGVPVVPFFSVGRPDRMRFEFEPAFRVEKEGPQREAVERKVRYFIGRVEQRMLADIPCWQHWMVPDVFGSLETWREKPINERYAV